MNRPRVAYGLVTVAVLGAVLYSPVSGKWRLIRSNTECGYFQTTRWGHKVFQRGAYHIPVSDEVGDIFFRRRGHPIEITISKWDNNMHRIEQLEKAEPFGMLDGLSLRLRVDGGQVRQGEGVLLHLEFTNDGDRPIEFVPINFEVVLCTDSPFANEAIDYVDPDGRNYWHCTYPAGGPDDGAQRPSVIACRQIRVPWNAEEMVRRGTGIRLASQAQPLGPLLIDPGGKFAGDFVVGRELLPDDYEVYYHLLIGNIANLPGPMSVRVPFDVVAIDTPADDRVVADSHAHAANAQLGPR